MTDHQDPDIIAARAADPEWQAEQERKREAASERFARYRESVGLPMRQQGRTFR